MHEKKLLLLVSAGCYHYSFNVLLNLRDGLSFHEVIAVYRVAVLMLSILCNRVEVDCRGVLVLYTNGLPNPNSVDMEIRNYK